ncbi:gliding-motility protein MglA [candidate division KSB1 bacterium]|nr:gliding-motility protein MglA [candidate division KSB1 bacterium]NIR73454.1 gliding-motility protein MglA [candidate division KSB1 bacterium]NIS27069.1 gliding-motility protein MglA [candidate division KSB1 bacterium]NIT73913.1 gliding-motility protein MglA [candidate division KSB1 bacterium]NIU27814.1 gliding-motility protein MglA [candidate division KSB1 bacterium]
MFINKGLQEINLKIVYYGPGLSGKTTNLEFIYQQLDPTIRSDLVSLKTREERTLYFDFMQLELGQIKGKKPRFNLYTVPGQVYYTFSRKIILRGVDGIVFVADSQKHRMSDNLDSLLDLEQNLINMGHTLQNFPWIIQYNKRDLPDIEAIETLQSNLNFFGASYTESVATQGVEVIKTLKMVMSEVISKIDMLVEQ